MASYICSIFIATTTLLQLISCQSTRIQTNSGVIQGSVVSLSEQVGFGLRVDEYLGIPYAKPPTGDLRFKPPQPAEPWTRVLEANKQSNACLQRVQKLNDSSIWAKFITEEFVIKEPLSEDCLYLNVWTPSPRPQNAAVLVMIHGGGYTMGASVVGKFNAGIMAGYKNVVVVSMNYRLDTLGFLYLGLDGAQGNVGLLDQQLALKWVKENIGAFGGDPSRITIFGVSAGAGSVSLHLLSRDSRRYFTRGVMESGVADAPWSVKPRAAREKESMDIAQSVECPHDAEDKEAILECLRNLDGDKIVNHPRADINMGPVDNDGTFLTDTVADILSSESFYKAEIMLGANANEGSMFLPIMAPHAVDNNYVISMNASVFRQTITTLIVATGSPFYDSEVVKEATVFQYTNWSQPDSPTELALGLDQMFGDTWFVCPMTRFAQVYARADQRTYVYFYTHRSSQSIFPEWTGALHGDDGYFVMGVPLVRSLGYTDGEREFSKTLMKYWVNFAQSGSPNTDENNVKNLGRNEPEWPERTAEGREYLTLTADPGGMVVGAGPREDYCVFWGQYVQKLADSSHTAGGCPEDAAAAAAAIGKPSLWLGIYTLILLVLRRLYGTWSTSLHL